jgi:hypothetical protein
VSRISPDLYVSKNVLIYSTCQPRQIYDTYFKTDGVISNQYGSIHWNIYFYFYFSLHSKINSWSTWALKFMLKNTSQLKWKPNFLAETNTSPLQNLLNQSTQSIIGFLINGIWFGYIEVFLCSRQVIFLCRTHVCLQNMRIKKW